MWCGSPPKQQENDCEISSELKNTRLPKNFRPEAQQNNEVICYRKTGRGACVGGVGGGGGGMGPVPTVPLLVHPGIGECAGASWGEWEGGGVGIVLNNVNASPHESFKHDPFQT